MKLKNTYLFGTLGVVAVVLVALALAQDTESPKTCPFTAALSAGSTGACSACPTSQKADLVSHASSPAVQNLPVYLDGPAALLAQAEKLGLTDLQKNKLQAILAEARNKAVSVLTEAQVAALGTVPAIPVIMAQTTGISADATTTTGECPMGGSCGDCNTPCDGAASQINAAVQTTCPVTGEPINASLSVEYEGQTVYFCCPGCANKFKADPAGYVANLPQFSH